jgi:hypothetical protein
MMTSMRTSLGRLVWTIVVGGVLGGCAAAADPSGTPSAMATQEESRAADVAKLAQSCVANAVKGTLSDLEDVHGLLRSCVGAAETKAGRIVAAHAALLLLANYGERSIRVFKDEDIEHAGADATLLKARVQKARERLKGFKESTATDLEFWSEYSAAMDPNGSDVMLYGVARAALAPLVRRSKTAARQYISAAAGGVGGVLREVLERRETILRKGELVRATARLGSTALVEARCAVEYVDPPKPGASVADLLGRTDVCHDFKRLDGAGKPDVTSRHWKETEQLLDETIKRLDKIIDEAGETV